MPLHGKIVVIKRSGGDGTEFPLTAACLFGRKPDCDIRIQLPEVSKEHCRIDLNENKEVILTNLSSVNPTRINGEALQQSERLKHGDVITIIDRSFRFEYPPAPTPKKRSSVGGKTKTFKVLQDQQVGDTVSTETGEKRVSEVSTDPHLKDGTNHDNIQRSLEKTMEPESKEDDSLLQNKTTSPFNDLYQMIKKSLDVTTPRKSSASLLVTPTSRFCTPKPVSVRKTGGNPVISSEDETNPKKDETKFSCVPDETKEEGENQSNGTPKSVKKQRKSFQVPSTEIAVTEAEYAVKSEATSPLKRNRVTPQRFIVSEVIEQDSTQIPRSPMRRRSKETTPAEPGVTEKKEKQAVTSPKTEHLQKASPRNSGKFKKEETSQKRKSGVLAADLTQPQMKRKRVSFGGHLSPELFDKRLPPDSPLRRGATPRRSLCLIKPKQSLLRRASVIGLLQEFEQEHPDSPNVRSPAKRRTPSPKKTSSAKSASPKTPTPGKKSAKSRSPSPKASTPAKKSPKSRSPSPKASAPAKKSPKSSTSSPKASSPARQSPKSRSPSPKASTPSKKSSKASTSSPKASSPARQSPKSRSPSPKASTPAKKSPKSSTSSPKASTPAKKSPKSSTSSPKASTPAKKSPKSSTSSPKASTPGKKTPKSRSPSPKAASPASKSPKSRSVSPKVPLAGKKSKSMSPSSARRSASKNTMETPGVQTPRIEGRFSVSHIRTPSPVAEDTNTDQVPSVTTTPKLPLRRKSMKSASRKTPSLAKSAAKVLRKRSGISRVSMKVLNSWANIVKFGKTKAQVAAPAKKNTTQKTKKKAVSKPQTPARKLKDHESTGHADSPVTFVVGRAHRQKVVHPTGAAPRLVSNTALLKKNLKMDEDLTGISEMYKTPVSEKKWRSVVNENSALKTPAEGQCTSVVEPSVLNTPEESGEMMVSPLTVSSAVIDKRYNSEAVQRLFNGDQESSFITDNAAMEIQSDDSVEQQCTDLKTSVTTPKQKPELPECLTGVKRIMKTPRQKAEPVEDLRGKLLKTPRQKPQQQECLSGVKRIMKTPRQKAEPVEDLRGNILKTPKQKPEQQECLTGVKRIFKTPQQETEPLEEKHLDTPEAPEAGHVSLDGVKQTEEMPANMQDSEDQSEMTDMKTPNEKGSPSACLTGIKRIMKTPKEKSAPVEDMIGVKRLMKTPREKTEPVDENFGIKRLVKSPRLKGNSPVEDFEGLQELMEEPVIDSTGQLDTNEVEDQTPQDCGVKVAKELDFAHEEPQKDVPSDVTDVAQVDMEKEADANEVVIDEDLEEVPSGQDNNESSDTTAALSQSAQEENLPVEEPKVNTEDDVSEEQAEMETVTGKVSEIDTTACMDRDHDKKPVRGRRAKVVASELAEEKQEATEQTEMPVIAAPVRGRGGKKSKATAPPAARQAGRGRNAKSQENTSEEPAIVPEKVDETTLVTETSTEVVSDQASPTSTQQEENDAAPPAEEAVVKPTRGRKTKQTPVEPPQPEKNDDVSDKPLEAEAQPQKSTGKPRRGRKTKADSEQNEVAEDTVNVVENKQQSQPPVRAKRGRNAKQEEEKLEMTESKDIELVTEKTISLSSKVVLKPKRGRNAKKSSDDQADQEVSTETDTRPEPESEQSLPTDVEANNSAAPLEKVASKAKRGKKTKQEQSVPEQQDVPCTHTDDILQVDMKKDANEVCSDQLEVLPNECDENKSGEATETVSQAPATESLPEVDTAASIVPKMDPPVIQKKPVRGRRAKVVDSKSVEEKQEATEQTEEPVIAAPVRGRRGKKYEATAPPAARQTGRGRNAKSQENTSEEPAILPEKVDETALVTETSTEVVGDQASPTNTQQEENDAAPPAEEAVVKPTRGRKTKQTPVEPPQPEPEKNEAVSEELPEAEAQPQKSTGKPRRGRKTKADSEQNEVAEDTVNVVENKQQSQPSVRAKRGRNAKQEEEKLVNDSKSSAVETTKEPVKKMGRTRKAEQDHVEPSEEIQTVKMVVSEDTKALLVPEQVKMNEQAAVAAKPRRGGRKAKQDTESKTPVKSTEVQEVTAVSSTDKQKRGRRGKQVPEEVEVTAVVPEEKSDHELKAEEESKVEPDTPVAKRSRARGVKNEVSQSIPAKRARRGAALPNEESSAESTVLVTESVSASVEPVKRGRRAAVKPTANDAAVTSVQTNPTEDLSSAVVEDVKMSKKSVKWKTNLEVFEIAEVTPIKAVRGRKSKLGDQVDTDSKNVSKDASNTEETDLSDKVSKARPVKRARRDANVADVTADKDESETQPKTRRGRSAKK